MTSKLPTYSDYKASGIDWLGDIPSHWECVKSQYIFSLASGETINGEDFSKGGLYPVYGGNGIRGYHDKYNLEGKHILIGRVGALCGNIHITPEKSWVSEHALIATPLKQVNLHWLSSLLETMKLGQYSMASAQPVIAASNVGKLHIPIPPIYEQKVIAAYLDDVTGKVDALIAEKRKQVEDIRAYRTSLITETVTHGLNPDAPLRPSGIDWLGNIPSHWKQCKLKHCAELVLGKMLQTQKPSSGDYSLEKYLKSRNVSSLSLSGLNNLDEMWFSDYEKCLYLLKEGDIVMNEGGEIGKVARWIPQSFDCYIQNSVHKITPNEALNSGYLEYYLFTIANIGYFNSIVSQISIAHLTKEKLSNTPVMVPPLAEQQSIADFLDAKIAKIDELISELTKQIDELTEYKQAVITEAVTGKVDVRDYKPSN